MEAKEGMVNQSKAPKAWISLAAFHVPETVGEDVKGLATLMRRFEKFEERAESPRLKVSTEGAMKGV